MVPLRPGQRHRPRARRLQASRRPHASAGPGHRRRGPMSLPRSAHGDVAARPTDGRAERVTAARKSATPARRAARMVPDPPTGRSPSRPDDPRDAGLPRRQRLVLRQGDPPRRRPRLARGLPHQHAARLHRQPAPDAARPARALLLARVVAAASSSGSTRAPGSGHVAEHIALAAPAGRRPRHPPRQDPAGQGPARATTTSSTGTSTSRSVSRPPGSPYAWSTTSSRRDPDFDWDEELEAFILRAERTAFGPSTQAILDEAVVPRHPLDPAQPALAGPARPGRPPAADPRHDDVGRPASIAVDIASDKDLTTRLLGAAGLPVPKQESVRDRRPGGRRRRTGSATPSWSSRSTATTAAGSASTCRTTTTSARPSRSPRSSPAAAG